MAYREPEQRRAARCFITSKAAVQYFAKPCTGLSVLEATLQLVTTCVDLWVWSARLHRVHIGLWQITMQVWFHLGKERIAQP